MKKYSHFYVSIFIDSTPLNSIFIRKIYILLYFTQMLAPLCKFYIPKLSYISLKSLCYVILCTNFTNILIIINSFGLYFVIFVLALCSYFICLSYVPLRMFFSRYLKINHKIYNALNSIIKNYLIFLFWGGYLAYFDIFICYFDRIWSSVDNKLMMTFAGLGMSLTFIINLKTMICNRNYEFCEMKGLKMNNNLLWILLFFLRSTLIVLYPVINNNVFFIYLVQIGFSLISMLHYFYFFPIRNPLLSSFYISILCSYLNINLILAIWDLSQWINEDHLFFILIITSMFAFKLGDKIFEFLHNFYIYKKKKEILSIYDLEEIKFLSEYFDYDKQSKFFLTGFLKNHFKYCTIDACKILRKDLLNFSNFYFVESIRLINRFIESKLKINIKNKKTDNSYLNLLSFYVENELNYIKVYFHIEKMNYIQFSNKKNIFNETILYNLKKKIKKKIKEFDQTKTIEKKHNEQSIYKYTESQLDLFWKSLKIRKKLEDQYKSILISKQKFWESYINEITNMSDLLKSSTNLTKKIDEFNNNLNKISNNNDNNKLIKLKFLTIFNSVLSNSINLSVKFEEEYENLRKHTTFLSEKNEFHLNNINNGKTVVCQISYLSNIGLLKNHTKNIKLAQFFGYSLEEFQLIRSIESIMPKIISKNHNKFLENYINGDIENAKSTDGSIITFALSKQEFIFPVKILIGVSYEFNNDFVLISTISKLENNLSYKTWYCLDNGNNIGISQGFYFWMKQKYPFLINTDYELLNIFNFLPFIKEIIEENEKLGKNNKIFTLKNLFGYFIIPFKFKEIIEILREKRKEEYDLSRNEIISSHKNINSNKSIKSANALKNCKYIFSLNKTVKLTNKTQEIMAKKLQEKALTNSELYKLILTETTDYEKLSVNIDLTFQTYGFGSNQLKVFNVIFLKTEEITQSIYNKTEDLNLTSSRNEILPIPVIEPTVMNIFSRTENANLFQTKENKTNLITHPFKVINDHEKIINDLSNKNDSELIEDTQNYELNQNKFNVENNSSSSKNSIKKSFVIYQKISEIQKTRPSNIMYFLLSSIIDIFLILIFCIVSYRLSISYIDSFYRPLQSNLIGFCKLGSSVIFSSVVTTEMEYDYLLISPLDDYFSKYTQFFNESYQNIKLISDSELNSLIVFDFQQLYRNLNIEIFDYQTLTLLNISYINFIDYSANSLNNLLMQASQTILSQTKMLDYHMLINIQMNFPIYVLATGQILLLIEKEFLNSNSTTTQYILISMLTFMAVNFLIKIFLLKQLLVFQNKITDILNILKRVNEKEANKEILFCKEMNKIMNDHSDSYFDICFSEKCFNKQNYRTDENINMDNSQNNASKSNKKKIKKKTFLEFKPLSKLRIFVFITLILGFSFCFYFFNYFFWIINNENIQNLIKINIFFENLYIYSSSSFGFLTLFLREKVVFNQDYEDMPRDFLKSDYRSEYFERVARVRIENMRNITGFELAKYTLDAKKSLNNPNFSNLIESDVCNILSKYQDFYNKIIDTDECRKCWDGAFLKGVMNFLNEYLNNLITLIDLLSSNKTVEEYNIHINSESHKKMIPCVNYLSNALLLYYNFISDHYNSVMENQINSLIGFLISSTVFFFLMFTIICFSMLNFLKKIYKYSSLILGIIPYERILNDEQTIFLINQFLKKH